MKAAKTFHRTLGLVIIPFAVLCLTLLPGLSQAQENGYPAPSEQFSRQELVQMLAPIALYPDSLLSQILMASTYPIEVIEADRWVRNNPGLKGDSLDAALLDKDWDPSVEAICHFPSILALMSERITETTNLGNAFLAQEGEMMDVIQDLRAEAYAQGNLTTSSQQKVILENETIIIEPADPRVVYVPYYDPLSIYGAWRYPDYPPYYWGPSGVSIGFGISYWPRTYFSFTFGTWSHFDWPRHSIYIDVHRRPRFVRHDRWPATPGPWQHAPSHRRGVAYRDTPTARKYVQYPPRSRENIRVIRDFPGHQSQSPDRRSNKRPVIDRNKHTDRTSIDRNRQKQQQIVRQKQQYGKTDANRQRQQRIDRNRQDRQRTERQSQERVQVDQGRQRVDRQQPPGRRNTDGNQVADGRRKQQSSERGQMISGKGQAEDSADRGRSGGEDRGRDRR